MRWTLDGWERLMDYLRRMESELEDLCCGGAEVRMDSLAMEEEGEGDVVVNPGIKLMWLLRFFTSWGARWSVSASTATASPPPAVIVVLGCLRVLILRFLSRHSNSSLTWAHDGP